MTRKKLVYSMALIALFMGIDFIAIYDYMIGVNSPIVMAVMLGLIVAALLDIPPFFIAGYGYAVLLDDSSEDDQRKSAKIITILGSIYILLILGALVTTRVIQVRENMNDPEYDSLFRDIVSLLIPVLTTTFSIILGLKAHEKNKVKLRECFETDADAYNQIRAQYDEMYNGLNGTFEAIGVDADVKNLMEAVESGSDGTNACIDSINQAALSQVKSRYELQLMQLPNILSESLNKALLQINSSEAAFIPPPDAEFERKAAALREPEKFFVDMVDEQIKATEARKSRSQRNEEGLNYA